MFDCLCEVDHIGMDFNTNTGYLHTSNGHYPDMLRCIASFADINPDVRRIETYVDGVPDTVYAYVPAVQNWNAFPPTEAFFGEIK
jgi:hypothetical protein